MTCARAVSLGAILSLAVTCWAKTVEPMTMRAGNYEVEVRVELPYLGDINAKTVTHVCLSADQGNNYGMGVLSANNPLAKCPTLNIRQEKDELTFEIICEGKNEAKATAKYLLASEHFSGRITMKMGGKNMTITEIQAGRRIGVC